jgi:large subunit ribosomal protein L9
VKVLLLEDVANIGHAGGVVTVADGYARNYLIRRRMARPVTEGSVREVEQIRQSTERKRSRQVSSAQDLARQIEGLTLTFHARSGETGKLYGSITTADLAAALQEQIGQEVDRRKISADPLRHLGEHVVEVHLMSDVSAKVKVLVVPEESAAAAPDQP